MEYFALALTLLILVLFSIMQHSMNIIEQRIKQLTDMTKIIIKVLRKKKKCKKKFKWNVNEVTIFPNFKTEGTIIMTTVKVNQSLTATWGNPKDKFGNDATVQPDSVKFSSDNEEIATVEPNPDGGAYSCKVTTKTLAGAVSIRIKADANLNDDGDPTTGDDVKEIEGLLNLEVLAGEASTFGDATTSDATDVPEPIV